MFAVGVFLILFFFGLAVGPWTCHASEYPDRECCDLPTQTTTNDTNETITDTSTTRISHLQVSNIKNTIAILNCILARQLCFKDDSCSAILEIIPKVCGTELVACSTVTVTKCQAAIRTLQAFPFFKPTCLCREPHVDPECNSFRDLLFDHPCGFVTRKEKDPYPVDALPTCNHALTVCQLERKCIRLFEEFKSYCKVRDSKCRMDNRDLCYKSWSSLRLSPIFGCICPNNNMKKRCERIFSTVNHNPCLASDYSSTSIDHELGKNNVENPLVHANSALEVHADYDLIAVSVLENKEKKKEENKMDHHNKKFSSGGSPVQHHKFNPSTINQSFTYSYGTGKTIFQSTCQSAIDNCEKNFHCRMYLTPIIQHCDESNCNRELCMEALQGFYRRPSLPWKVEIALCLCQKTDNRGDSCLLAQKKLHPICAQRVIGATQPTCISVAEECRVDKECRSRLEYFEQACAVDSSTRKCAGPVKGCLEALLGILGTNLRTICDCKGTELGQLYECLGWRRLLWVNPCVVEIQNYFHVQRAEELAAQTIQITTKNMSIISTTTSAQTTKLKNDYILFRTKSTTSSPPRTDGILEYIPPPQAFIPIMRSTTNVITATTSTPPKYCVVKRDKFSDQYIKEGSMKRIYYEDEFECSDLCECEISEKLSCKTICIDRMPCKTEFAYYNHAAPAYQAFRGRCLCYSGRFICMKPIAGNYNLPQGVFLFLGYSEVDERELNRNQTRIVVQDVVKVLQNFIKLEAMNETFCMLELFNSTKENIIIAGKLSEKIDYSTLSSVESLNKEKEQCAVLFETISEKINSRDSEFISQLLLSIFKMAEVEIIQIMPNSSFHLKMDYYLCIVYFYSLFMNSS